MIGLGRPTPSRFPYPGRPETAPGLGAAQGQLIRARKVIILGASGQFVAYSTSTPQPNSVVGSFVAVTQSDGAGNMLLGPGFVSYYGSGPYFAEQLGGGEVAIWTAASQAGPWGLLPQGIFFEPTGNTQLFSQSGSFVSLNGAFAVPNGGVSRTLSNNPIFLASGSVAQIWTAFTLINGWDNAAGNVSAQWRPVASPPNCVEIIGTLAALGATAATFATFAAAQFPAHQQQFPTGATGGAPANQVPFVQCDTAGNLSIQHATLGAADTYPFHGLISLDA